MRLKFEEFLAQNGSASVGQHDTYKDKINCLKLVCAHKNLLK